MADQNETLKTVVQVLNDGARGYADFAEHAKDATTKSFFMSESQTRGEYARELSSAAGISEDVGGTAVGSVHRVWGDLKQSLGAGDHQLYDNAGQGEEAAQKAYQAALAETGTSSTVRQLLVKQQAHIQQVSEKIKTMQNATE